MKMKILALTLALSATLLGGCDNQQGYTGQASTDWNRQALQKHYTSLAWASGKTIPLLRKTPATSFHTSLRSNDHK